MKLLKKPEIYGETNVGMVRTGNEDTFIAETLPGGNLLCAAIDGLGGYEGGEVAAEIARQTITEFMAATSDGQPLERLKKAVTEANNAIVRRKDEDPMRARMGCVVSAGLISPDQTRLWMVHVGDSRLYLYRDGQLTKLSHDHSVVGYREEIGELTEEEAMAHPQRNMIERALGDEYHNPDDPHFLDAAVFPIEGDSQFLFCSDGLSDMLTSAEIARELGSDCDLATKAANLIQAANNKGGKDNITVVIARLNYAVSKTSVNRNDTAPTDKKKKTPKKSLLAAAAVGLLAIGGAAGYFAGRSSKPSQAEYEAAIQRCDSLTAERDSLANELDAATELLLGAHMEQQPDINNDESSTPILP